MSDCYVRLHSDLDTSFTFERRRLTDYARHRPNCLIILKNSELPMKHLLALAIPCALAAAYAAPAHAEDTDDRFQIRLGAMNVDNDNTIRGNTLLAGNNVSVNEDFKLGGKEWEPRVDGVFRISTRQRLIFDYFKYDKDRRETLSQDVSAGGVTVPSGSFIKGELKYQVATFGVRLLSDRFAGIQPLACRSVPSTPRSKPTRMPTWVARSLATSWTKAKTALRRSSVSASPHVRANTGCSTCRASTSTPAGATSATTTAT